jgi:hypothetical protein
MQSTTAARRHRAVGGTAAEQELEAVASAALLPLVGNKADIIHLVIKHYEWCLLLDRVSHLEQKYETMISKAEDQIIYLREEEFVIWQSYGPMMCDSDRRDWDFDMERSEREAWDIGWSIRVPPPTRTAIFNESKTFLAAVA